MNGFIRTIAKTVGVVGLASALAVSAGVFGKNQLDREIESLNNARVVSENHGIPREVVYDSNGDGKADTSRRYITGPNGGLFHYDRPLSE